MKVEHQRRTSARHRSEERILAVFVFALGLAVASGGQLAPDRFEPNNARTNASALGSFGDGTETNLTIYPAGDQDYWRIEAAWSGRLQADILFVHAKGDLDMYLYDSEGLQIDGSAGSTDGESVDCAARQGEAYFVRVKGAYGSTTNNYDLVINGPDLEPDDFEPNDGFATASDLGESGDITLSNLTVHAAGDEDYYRFTAAGDGNLAIELSFADEIGDLNLYLYDQASNLLASSESSSDNEFVAVAATGSLVYFIRVAGAGGATNEYSMVVDGPPWPGDRFEPDDGFAAAAALGVFGAGAESNLSVHVPGDEDFYRVSVPVEGELRADIFFVHAAGDLNLALYDANSNQLAASIGVDGNESVSHSATTGTVYYIHVWGYSGATNAYDLVVDGPAFPGDGFEPNEGFASARDFGVVLDRTETDLSVYPEGDNDYFRFTSAYSGSATVEIRFAHPDGDLDLEFYDSGRRLLAMSRGIEDSERISCRVEQGSNYYVRVYGAGVAPGPTNTYDLTIDGPSTSVLSIEPAASNRFVLTWSSRVGAVYDIGHTRSLCNGFGEKTAEDLFATPYVNIHTVNIESVESSGYFRIEEQ